MPSEVPVEEKRKPRLRRSLFPKVPNLDLTLGDMLAMKGAALPRVSPHMDLLRIACMCGAQVTNHCMLLTGIFVQGGGVAVPLPDHAGRQGHGGPRWVQDHQGAIET